MERLTDKAWGNLDPWECCGQDYYCKRGCHDDGGCNNGCIVPRLYKRLAKYEDAEESGLLVQLPIGVNTEVFSARYGEVEMGKVWQVEINAHTNPSVWIRFTINSKVFGNIDGHTRIDLAARDGIYFTREEAEAALKEG